MKRLFFALGLAVLMPFLAEAQTATSLRKIPNTSFKRGEIIKYRMHYGSVNAGECIISVENENKLIGGRSTFHVLGKGYSFGAFDWFFKVRDRYESYVDEDALVPWLFLRNINEGGYKLSQTQSFDHFKGKVISNGKALTVPINIQDMISSFYYARTLDYSKAKKGDLFSLQTFVDDEVWDLKIKFIGRETIKTDVGNVACMKFHPVVQKGRVFKKEEDLTVWISDDANHIPVRAEAEILIGSVKMDIKSHAGLLNPLNVVK
ncbi:MAG: DUF3108 domain-containing protein [Bacteroidia bacterium]